MPRAARKNLDGKYFHVMVQGIGKENVFPDDNCKGFYLACVQKNKEKYPAKLIAFCIMRNHAHLLLSVKDAKELASYLKRVNADYARYYNRVNKRVGYVFRDRFKSETIRNINYLANCVAYIQNNPLKAKLVENAEDYKFSSYTNYLTRRGIIDFEEASKIFDASAANMRAIMTEKTEMKWIEHNDKEYEDKFNVLADLVKRYRITSKLTVKNEDLAKKLALEIKERSGASLREIAGMLEIGRETLRKWLSIPPSP